VATGLQLSLLRPDLEIPTLRFEKDLRAFFRIAVDHGNTFLIVLTATMLSQIYLQKNDAKIEI
jgi:hypothetical protein